jgi:hypothetical protein
MPLWTLYDKTKAPANAILRQHEQNANGGIPGTTQTAENPTKPAGLSDELAWLVEQHTAEPTFDPSLQKLSRNNGVIAIDPVNTWTGTRTWGWSVIQLSDAELADALRVQTLQAESSAVGAIAQRWLDDSEPLESADVARVARFLAIQNGLDSQAP